MTLPTSTLTPEQAAALAAGLEDALGSLAGFLPVRRRQDDGAAGIIVDIPVMTTTSGIALSTNTTSGIESTSTAIALSVGVAFEVQDNDLPNRRRQDAGDADFMSEGIDLTSATINATTTSTTVTQPLSLGDAIGSSVSDLLLFQRHQEDSDAGVSTIATTTSSFTSGDSTTSTTIATVTDVLNPASMGLADAVEAI